MANSKTYSPGNAAGSTVPDTYAYTDRDIIEIDEGINHLELRRPSFGNTEEIDTNRLLRRSRLGILHMYKFTPTMVTLDYSCTALNYTKVTEYQAFVQATLGKKVTITDYETKQWIGVMFPKDVTQISEDFWKINFTFIGKRV